MGSTTDVKISKAINEIFNNMSYYELYSYDIWFTIIVILIFTLAITYFYILYNIKSLKSKYEDIKCNPLYIPFSRIISGGRVGSGEVFRTCLNNLTFNVAVDATNPLTFMTSIIYNIFNMLYGLVIQFLTLVSELISALRVLINYIIIKFKLIINEINYMFIKINSIFQKTFGSLLIFTYSITKVIDLFKLFVVSVCNLYFKCIVAPLSKINVYTGLLTSFLSSLIIVILYILIVSAMFVYIPTIAVIFYILLATLIVTTILLVISINIYKSSNSIYFPALNFGLNLNDKVNNFVDNIGTKFVPQDRMGYIDKVQQKQKQKGFTSFPDIKCDEDDNDDK